MNIQQQVSEPKIPWQAKVLVSLGLALAGIVMVVGFIGVLIILGSRIELEKTRFIQRQVVPREAIRPPLRMEVDIKCQVLYMKPIQDILMIDPAPQCSAEITQIKQIE